MKGDKFFIPGIFFVIAIADLFWFDVNVITPIITFAGFLYVIEDFLKEKPNLKNSVNILATIVLGIAILVFFKNDIPKENSSYPYIIGFITFMKNFSDFLTILSVVLVIIYKLYTADKTEKFEKLKIKLEKEYSASEIQSILEEGQRAVAIDKNSKDDYVIIRKNGSVVFSSFGNGNSPLDPNHLHKDWRFKIML
ncbi:hypothetical protein [Bacillus sp. 22-7]|uniref:hypothetical protein n=1 Tax=Bacillus sp. 22-7 TaxID=2709707 RepID=UPI0013CFFDE9|nr:hypothetical protein [Bacillus sp. 22-7]